MWVSPGVVEFKSHLSNEELKEAKKSSVCSLSFCPVDPQTRLAIKAGYELMISVARRGFSVPPWKGKLLLSLFIDRILIVSRLDSLFLTFKWRF